MLNRLPPVNRVGIRIKIKAKFENHHIAGNLEYSL